MENLFERLDRMVACGPTFCDITWGAGGSTADVTLGIATKMQNLVSRQLPAHCQAAHQRPATAAVQQQQYAGVYACAAPLMQLPQLTQAVHPVLRFQPL